MLILITGAGKGIGRATALKCADFASGLIIHSRTEVDLISLQKELLDKNQNLKVYICVSEISTKEGINKLSEYCLQSGLLPDVLINNAGIFLQGSIIDPIEDNLEIMMDTNFYSVYHLTRALLPEMIKRQSGTIVNMCSIAGLDYYPGGSHYCISKFALNGFSICLREECKPHGIRVVTVYPGATWSNSWKGVDLPKNRLMPAEDVAAMICATIQLGPDSVVEEIIMRPQLGDL